MSVPSKSVGASIRVRKVTMSPQAKSSASSSSETSLFFVASSKAPPPVLWS